MNKVVLIVAIVILVILAGVIVWFLLNPSALVTNNSNSTTNTVATNPNAIPDGKGMLYLTITDAAATMGSVSAVDVTIDKIDVYGAKQGWVTIPATSQTFSLLNLKAKSQALLLAKAAVIPDVYTQFKLHIAKITVTETGAQKEAKLPSSDFVFMANVKVDGAAISVGRFDIMTDKSIHKTATGAFIFAPVIKFDSSTNPTVKVAADNSVVVSKGLINPTVNAGMDATGMVKLNYILDPKTNLKIDATGVITTSGLLK